MLFQDFHFSFWFSELFLEAEPILVRLSVFISHLFFFFSKHLQRTMLYYSYYFSWLFGANFTLSGVLSTIHLITVRLVRLLCSAIFEPDEPGPIQWAQQVKSILPSRSKGQITFSFYKYSLQLTSSEAMPNKFIDSHFHEICQLVGGWLIEILTVWIMFENWEVVILPSQFSVQ